MKVKNKQTPLQFISPVHILRADHNRLLFSFHMNIYKKYVLLICFTKVFAALREKVLLFLEIITKFSKI
jgi:hypothetical protein